MMSISNPYQSNLIGLYKHIHKQKHKHNLPYTGEILLHSNVQNSHRIATKLPMRTNAVDPVSVLAAASPTISGGGDISVIIQTGGVMLVAYLIANFVVPTILSKDFGPDEASEDQQSNKDNF